MVDKNKIASIIVDGFPGFLSEEYPLFVEFMQRYFDWLEQDDNSLGVLSSFKSDMSTSSASTKYLERTLSGLGFAVGADTTISKRHVIHFLKEFYLSRGSEESFNFLFKIFFNEDVRIDYPRRKLAKTSSAVFSGKRYIFTTAASKEDQIYKNVVHKNDEIYMTSVIRGGRSGVITSVESMFQYGSLNKTYLTMSVLESDRHHILGEPVDIIHNDERAFTEQILSVGELSVVNGGTEYDIGDLIQVSSPDSYRDGTYRVSRTSRGKVDGVIIDVGGADYRVGDVIRAVGVDRGAGFCAEVASVDEAGDTFRIESIRIINPGWGYKTLPQLTVLSNTGVGATLRATSSSVGRIVEVKAIEPIVFHAATSDFTVTASRGRRAVSGQQIDCVLSVEKKTHWDTEKTFEDTSNGFLGSNFVLTDSELYQQFSYEVISNLSGAAHKSISDTVHPVGYIRYNVTTMGSSIELPLGNSGMYLLKMRRLIYPDINNMDPHHVATPSCETGACYNPTKIKVLYVKPKRLTSMSINILDKHKFSDNFTNNPRHMPHGVIDSAESNKFTNHTLDAEVSVV